MVIIEIQNQSERTYFVDMTGKPINFKPGDAGEARLTTAAKLHRRHIALFPADNVLR
jgi:hypothetical protein